MGPLAGRVAIITGGSRGIGLSLARAFLGNGAVGVTVTASVARDELERAAAELGPGALAVVADVTDADACGRVVADTVQRFGSVDILVNNAAKGARYAGDGLPFYEADPEGWRLVIDTNINGPFHMTRAAVPHMLRRKWGRIINVSKSADTMHDRAASPYGTSKAALEAMTASWAEDLAGTGVTVNSLAPGGQTDTAFGTPAGRESARAAGRLLAPDVMDGVAVWLASDASSAESGSRFIGRLWDADLPVAQAVERAREPSIFRVPARRSKG